MTHPDNLAYVEATIAALYVKLGKARQERRRCYYRACIRGWLQTRDKLRAKGGCR